MKYIFLRFPEGKFKAVTLSYDDGHNHDIRLAQTLDKYGLKGTFNLTSKRIGQQTPSRRLTVEDIKEHLLSKGHEIAVHGEDHIAPVLSRPTKAIQDVLNCRLYLEQTFGIMVRGMAFPDVALRNFQNGATKENVQSYLKDLGIVYARDIVTNEEPLNYSLPADWLAWNATVHHSHPKAAEYAREFVALDQDKLYKAKRWPKCFMLWGHSFEFDRENNWELLDELCQILAGKEDTWYATCMEIYEYVQAYNALVFSADSTRVYNPTLHTVWFDVDSKLYSVAPGDTITIA